MGDLGSSTKSTVFISADGLSWDSYDISIGARWSSITYGNNVFVAVSPTTIAYSTDGISWQTISMTLSYNNPLVIFGNNKFFIVDRENASSSDILISTDGANWTATGTAGKNVTTAIYEKNLLIIAYSDKTIRYSVDDGASWKGVSSSFAYAITAIIYTMTDEFIAFANNRLYKSTDGITWSQMIKSAYIGGENASNELTDVVWSRKEPAVKSMINSEVDALNNIINSLLAKVEVLEAKLETFVLDGTWVMNRSINTVPYNGRKWEGWFGCQSDTTDYALGFYVDNFAIIAKTRTQNWDDNGSSYYEYNETYLYDNESGWSNGYNDLTFHNAIVPEWLYKLIIENGTKQ